MQFPARSTMRAARQLRAGTQRRYASDGHHHAEAVNESIGSGFWIAVATIPICYGVYTLSRPGADGKTPYFTELINQYTLKPEDWERRNSLHTKMIEQAAFDRNLFQSEKPSQVIPLKFQE